MRSEITDFLKQDASSNAVVSESLERMERIAANL